MIKISTNANQVSINLKNLGNLDTSPLMRVIAGDLEDIVETAFENEADPVTGRRWDRLTPRTIEARRRKGKWPGKKLQVTGRLVSSITTKATRTTARIGTNVKYSGPNQKRRRFIGMGPKHIRKLRRRVLVFVKNKFNSA